MRERERPAGVDVYWATRAHILVQKAIRAGEIPCLKDKKTKCSDCKFPATEYDHGDYHKPLEVEPVCRSCNIKRGVAIWPKGPCPRRLYMTANRKVDQMKKIKRGLKAGRKVKLLADATGYTTQRIYQIKADMVRAGELQA